MVFSDDYDELKHKYDSLLSAAREAVKALEGCKVPHDDQCSAPWDGDGCDCGAAQTRKNINTVLVRLREHTK